MCVRARLKFHQTDALKESGGMEEISRRGHEWPFIKGQKKLKASSFELEACMLQNIAITLLAKV